MLIIPSPTHTHTQTYEYPARIWQDMVGKKQTQTQKVFCTQSHVSESREKAERQAGRNGKSFALKCKQIEMCVRAESFKDPLGGWAGEHV